MENKDFLAEIANIDYQAEKAIIELFNQYKVDNVVVEEKWVAVDCDFIVFDIITIAIINGDVTLTNPYGDEYYIGDLLGGEMSRLYQLLEDEIDNLIKNNLDCLAELESNRIVDYEKNPKIADFLVFVPNSYLADHKVQAEDDDNFIIMGYHYGKVLTAEEFAKAYNAYQLGDLTNNDKYTMRTFKMDTKCVEMCPHCENEVLLDTKFEMQTCPICGEKIAPCNLCGSFCSNNCPLKCK